MTTRVLKLALICLLPILVGASVDTGREAKNDETVESQLWQLLRQHGFTGRIESTFEQRLGRKVDNGLADLGRLLFHDPIVGLNDDNSCSGCHSATAGFGDTQSIAIGVQNNFVVGPHRTGPRNQRRTPMVVNTAFFPTLMWNSRFASLANDPFDNSAGLSFPPPEGLTLSNQTHLLMAQAFIPPTERVEAAGFVFEGDNADIRDEVIRRLNDVPEYRKLFGKHYPRVKQGDVIDYDMFAQAIAEFEFTLIFADAPIDRFARGEKNAMSEDEKKGALLFFGKAGCVACHSVRGESNEMFSDFRQHVVGVPQIAPVFGNVTFDGPGSNEDFGLEQVTGNADDRYMFRTSPIRNVSLQTAFFHNGAFTRLEDALRFHLNPSARAIDYDAAQAGVAPDLQILLGPIEPVLFRLDPLLQIPVNLREDEFDQLLLFLKVGLLDRRARPEYLRKLIPTHVPSGRALQIFE